MGWVGFSTAVDNFEGQLVLNTVWGCESEVTVLSYFGPDHLAHISACSLEATLSGQFWTDSCDRCG